MSFRPHLLNCFIPFRITRRAPNGRRQVHTWMSCQVIIFVDLMLCSRVSWQCSEDVLAPSPIPEHLGWKQDPSTSQLSFPTDSAPLVILKPLTQQGADPHFELQTHPDYCL